MARTEILSVRMPRALLRSADEVGDLTGFNRSTVVRIALEQYLSQRRW